MSIKNLIIFLLIFTTTQAKSLEIQERRHSICGVEKYKTLTNDSRCPVSAYFAKSSPACQVIFNEKSDPACGYDAGNFTYRCVNRMNPNDSYEAVATTVCRVSGPSLVYELQSFARYKKCRLERFGIAGYETCRNSSHGVESYQACSSPDFGVESFNSCKFYKTPEEMIAYIEATDDSYNS